MILFPDGMYFIRGAIAISWWPKYPGVLSLDGWDFNISIPSIGRDDKSNNVIHFIIA